MAKRSKRKSTKSDPPMPALLQPVVPQNPWRRRVGLLLFVIALLKLGMASTAVVEHFDEGVYASNYWFSPLEGGTYPARWFYAPPMLAWVIEQMFLIAGPSNFTAILPSAFCGLMTVLLSAIAAKRWSTTIAGWVAVALGMLSGYQTTFAQTALTDVPLGMWWLSTLVAIHQGCTTGKLWWGIVAGGACAAAWWTKYNGWMPLGIGLGGLVVAGVLSPMWRDKKAWIVVLLAIVTAAAAWSPYYFSLESVGGYGPINANHRGYIVGLAGWSKSVAQQWRNFEYLNSFAWGACELLGGWLLAIGLVLERTLRTDKNAPASEEPRPKMNWPMFAIGVSAMTTILALAVMIVGAGVPLFVFAISGLLNFLSDVRRGRATREEILGKSMLGVWFVGMFLATPLYTPYARLMVPFVISMWTSAAIGMTCAAEGIVGATREGTFSRNRGIFLWGTAACLGIGWGVTGGIEGVGLRGPIRTERQQAILDITHSLIKTIGAGEARSEVPTVLVYADPALFFQLRLAAATGKVGKERVPSTMRAWGVIPIGDLSFLNRPLPANSPPLWLLVGPQGDRDPAAQGVLKSHQEVANSIAIFSYSRSDYVLLDQFSPTQLEEDPMLRRESVELLRIGGKQ